MNRSKRVIFFILGILFLGLSYIGIIMPGIPAIPFILLAGWFFLNSSEKLYDWMLSKKIMGKILRKFFEGEGASKGMAFFVISQYWVSLVVAQLIFSMQVYMYVMLNLLGVLGSILIYWLIVFAKRKDRAKKRMNKCH